MNLRSNKFYIPPASPGLVARPRLALRFEEALKKPLTLLAAPAGYGKSTLAAEWARILRSPQEPGPVSSPPTVAWLSLEPADNAPARFWIYVVAALQGAFATLDSSATGDQMENGRVWGSNVPDPNRFNQILEMLQSNLPLDLEPVIDFLINIIDESNRLCVLVLDDYHCIENLQIHECLTYFVERLPPSMRLIIASRIDPPLPIHRLRARGQLNELRASDLRFSPAEAEELLQQISGTQLTQENVTALEKTTEGWAAGLQMAALALQAQLSSGQPVTQAAYGQDAIQQWIAGFSGEHYYILDYLAEEVFNHQPAELRDFLLSTSILDQFCAGLCDSVAAISSSQSLLDRLDRSNLFLIPLDSRRNWYRYHHLFADLLRARLRQQSTEWIATLHIRASAWYEQNGRVIEAVNHALEAHDWSRAASLIEQFWRLPVEQGEVVLALQWLDRLPPAIVSEKPALSFAYCWIYWLTGRISRMETHLEVVQQALESGPSYPDPTLAALWCQTPMFRAILLRQKGDVKSAIPFAKEAVERVMTLPVQISPEEKSLLLGVSYYQLAETFRFANHLAEAASAFTLALPLLSGRSQIAFASACMILSEIQQALGHLRQARESCQKGLDYIHAQPNRHLPSFAAIHVAAAEVFCEQNNLEQASQQLDLAFSLGKGQMTIMRKGAYVALRLNRARGSLAPALPALDEADRAVRKVEAAYLTAEVAAMLAKTWIELGELSMAAQWATQVGLPAGLEHVETYQLIELVVFARLLSATGQASEAVNLLDGCLARTEADGLWGRALEILLLRAVARQQRGDHTEALADVEMALALAEPEGYRRIFIDEGQPVAALLIAIQKRMDTTHPHEFSPAYLAQLLSEFPIASTTPDIGENQSKIAPAVLVEPLTEREMEVLRLLALGHSNREMAEILVVSEGTIKTHVHNLIAKLSAQSRTQAIALARQLRLI